MAKKHHNPLEEPPTASSSDDDEVETSESGEDEEYSSSDEESSKNSVKAPSAADTKASTGKSTAVSAAKQGSDSDSDPDSEATNPPESGKTVSVAAVSAEKKGSDSDSGSENETDSGSDSEATNPPKSGSDKTVSVTAVFAANPNKKDLTSSVALALPAAKSGTKRPVSEGTLSKDINSTKRAKIVTSGEEESIKKTPFQRLWSEEDEISVLQGMIDYKADTGESPYDDTNGFYEFVKKSISFEASKNQFMDKVRSLKKKFMGKEGKNGAEPSFAKAHDQKIYKLSKHIWGPEGLALESSIKSNEISKKSQIKRKKKIETVASLSGKKIDDDDDKALIHGGVLTKSDWFENSFVARSIADFGVDEYFVKQNWSLVPLEEKKKIKAKLKQLRIKEFDFVLEKTGFVHEVASMIFKALKNKPLDM